ncbi:hypothetical protein [Aneurinibacillus tyrosinisolvens]|uniref:hypothetical protein n=1 Tax=Aneurinibacillus tyrosinisolvens TaxID=1443435 RepID=UPI00063ED430|nr:hypothetical protein [Aneurinibacillus tyrosinisolvens]
MKTKRWNRIKMSLFGASYETIVKKGDIEKKVKTDLNGDMYFTKDPSTSEWKIYLTSFDRPATNE